MNALSYEQEKEFPVSHDQPAAGIRGTFWMRKAMVLMAYLVGWFII